MIYTADPRVDAYIDGLPVWQQAICYPSSGGEQPRRRLAHGEAQELDAMVRHPELI